MVPDEVQGLFMRGADYAFARWGRPIVPVVFGVGDETLATIKGAIEAVVALAGHKMAETDPELGANLMLFFLRDWAELLDVPNLGEMIPDLAATVARLEAAGAAQYRAFRFDEAGAIRAAFVFVRMAGGMEKLSAETVALTQAVQALLTWGEAAFAETSPLALHPGTGAVILRPEIAAVIRAAYDPVMPAAASDPSHALRLYARMQR
ncbi:hypothetical protein STA1M1_25340 [Sinisalibacter aestuarii]|uniref:Uncharacterized protein n=2 Tax=Sinisalibacter aestuarii TaxID=2949426 RepID=A0ABQ5LUK2_9RHOB|nr:hypothetical protein STA1M1_25340 [Sinisalibacter aestuarii]